MKGFDTASPLDALHIARLKAAGYGFVAGYASFNPNKNLTPSECRMLSAAGIGIVTVFEARGDRPLSFDGIHGDNDAWQALKVADQIGQPQGSVIYFAVDFDATEEQIKLRVEPYFRAAKRRLDGKYRIGVYGSGAVLTAIRGAGLAEFFWLANASGWRGTREYAGPVHIKQGLPSKVLGLSVDPDVAQGDFGQWMIKDIQHGTADPAA